MWLVIDREGAVWAERDPTLRERLSRHASPAAQRDFVARNMGYVLVHRGSNGTVVRLNPSLVTSAAIAETLVQAASWRNRRVLLEAVVAGSWRSEITSGSAFAARLSRLVEEAQQSRRASLRRRTLMQDEVAAVEPARLLLGLLARWEAVRAGLVPLEAFIQGLSNGRYVFAELRPDDRQLYVKSVGPHLEIANHFSTTTQRPVSQHPDPNYGRWIAQHYLEALIAGEPVFDEIEATIALTDVDKRKHRYLRLLLPLKRDLLLSATVAA